MLRTLRNSVAVIAASAALALPAAAQTTPSAPVTTPEAAPAVIPATPATPEAPATTGTPGTADAPTTTQAPAATETPATTDTPAGTTAALPQGLTQLGITDATVRDGRRGVQLAQGTLPGGGAFQAMLDRNGTLRMIRAADDATSLPAEIVAQLVPEAVRNAPIFAEFASVKGVGIGGHGPRDAGADAAANGVKVFGTDAQGQGLRAGFAADGTMQTFGRGDMDRGWGKKDGQHGGKHGRKGERKDRGDRGERGAERGDAEGARAPRGMLPAELDDAAVARILGDAGYTQPGAITREGPRLDVQAVNPNGEPVTLTINPRGVITREIAR